MNARITKRALRATLVDEMARWRRYERRNLIDRDEMQLRLTTLEALADRLGMRGDEMRAESIAVTAMTGDAYQAWRERGDIGGK